MSRRLPYPYLVGALIVLIAITIVRWDLIWKSTGTLAIGIVFAVLHPGLPGAIEPIRLAEFWVASLIWWVSLAFLINSLVRRLVSRRSEFLELPREQTQGAGSFSVLFVLAFISFTTPFFTPAPPNSQGDLANTRLLRPLAQGVLFEYPVKGAVLAPEGLRGWYIEATQWLLSNRSVASGKEESNIRGAPSGGQPGGRFVFLFGTDDNGRDVLSRVIAGTRVSLGIGVVASVLSLVLGVLIGFTAGMGARSVDFVLMRLTDLALAVPGLFLAIGLMAFLGQSLMTLVAVLVFTGWMSAARVIRGEVLGLREKEYILTARLLGVSTWRIVVRHMLPNLAPVLVSVGVLQFANVVLAEAALGFLGLGVQPPTATWGNMMGEAMGTLQGGWWVGLFPGAFLASVLVAAHELADGSSTREPGDVRGRHDQSSIQDHQ